MSAQEPPAGAAPSGRYHAVVVGSGFGGAFTALPLVQAGARVLLLERGEPVDRGPHNWSAQGSFDLTPYARSGLPYRVLSGGLEPVMRSCACVGGASVFYGGVSLRLRRSDFEPRPELRGSGAAWPFGYDELEPFYARAEELLGVTGEAGRDPTEPGRSAPFPHPAPPLSETSRLVAEAGASLGLRPFPLPLAINRTAAGGRAPCQDCTACDTYACAVSAKNDVATAVLPGLVARGLELRSRTLATRLLRRGTRLTGVEAVDLGTGAALAFEADQVVLAAGALSSAHLVLASGLREPSPAGDTVGRYLTRHCAAIVFGLFPRLPDRARVFHKQVGFHDLYHGAEGAPEGQLGSIQQVQSPPPGLIQARLPVDFDGWLPRFLSHVTGLLVLAEDQPQAENRVTVDGSEVDRFGLPRLLVALRHSGRDEAARRALLRQARAVLRRAGALATYTHVVRTFSHAAGTLRAGLDPATSPLDERLRFRGVDNLTVVDGSFLPTAGGVNPSLTIAAGALRAGEILAREGA